MVNHFTTATSAALACYESTSSSAATSAGGQEIAGTVVRVGPGCTWKPGDAVISMTRFAEGMGGFAELCQVPESLISRRPRGMTAEECAGFWVPFHTGYVGVVQRGQLAAGETLLVLGGAGSSGSAAIQLGKALGARVIATVSSADKADFCRSLGAASHSSA